MTLSNIYKYQFVLHGVSFINGLAALHALMFQNAFMLLVTVTIMHITVSTTAVYLLWLYNPSLIFVTSQKLKNNRYICIK